MGIVELWMPILVSAVLVFIASALVWMVLPWHKTDFRKTGDEEAVRAALKGSEPGLYLLPYHTDPADLQDEAVQKKYIDGPQAYVTVIPNGLPQMGQKLGLSFLYYVFIGILCAYFVSRTTGPDAEYFQVFRIAGTTAFIAHGVAYVQESIWFGRPWPLTAKSFLDALIYSVLTGGAFAGLG